MGEIEERPRAIVAMPKNIRVFDEETSEPAGYRAGHARRALLERRWFTRVHIFLLIWCLIWDGILSVAYASMIAKGDFKGLWFPLIHVTIGIVLTYVCVCGFVNRTRISIEGGLLTIKHGPLPWPGNRTVEIATIEQLFTQEHVGGKGTRSYSLNMRSKTGDTVDLLKGLDKPEQALFPEQALEERLGIADAPVAGELR